MLTMAELGVKAGAGKLVMEYLECRGILSVGALASTGKDYESAIIQPLFCCYDAAGRKFELAPADQPIAKAMLKCMRVLACEALRQSTPAASSVPVATSSAAVATSPRLERPTKLREHFATECLVGCDQEVQFSVLSWSPEGIS